MRAAAKACFWGSAALIAWTQVGYGLALTLAERLAGPAPSPGPGPEPGEASLVVAAHDEAPVIAAKVADALAQGPAEVIVACDGCTDDTAALARRAGADVVLELPRGGKIRAQDAAVRAASGRLLAFSDANARWEPGALRTLLGAFADPRVGYACGQVRFCNREGGTNQEGLYWRWEMVMRHAESRLASITAGNGAIYATRRESYLEVDPVMGHDLSLPASLVRRGWRALYVPQARASEPMVPSIEGEFARKRRMMSHTWAIVLRGGLLWPRGLPPAYALMVLSHRLLRYATPGLHVLLLATSVGLRRRRSARLALAAQAAVLLAALAPSRRRPALLARYYVLTTASIAAGLLDYLRDGVQAAWETAEGTR